MWIVQQMSFQPLTSLVSLLKRLWTFCLCHGTVKTKTWQKCMGMVSCFGCGNGLSSKGMVFFVYEWSDLTYRMWSGSSGFVVHPVLTLAQNLNFLVLLHSLLCVSIGLSIWRHTTCFYDILSAYFLSGV